MNTSTRNTRPSNRPRFISLVLVMATMLTALLVGSSTAPASAAYDPYAPKKADWSCSWFGSCDDFKQWYASLPWAAPSKSDTFRRDVARRLAVSVYGSAMYGKPGLRASIDSSIWQTDPRCVAKVILDDAYRIARAKEGKVDLLMRMVNLAMNAPGVGTTVKAVYTVVWDQMQGDIQKSLDVDIAAAGLNRMVSDCG